MTVKLHCGNSKEVLKDYPDNSFDSIVTDPPYELGFMGKKWDGSGIAYDVELWAECLRVLKPGGYLLAFSGTRTYHRMTCAIEDAGFEIRDMVEWVYGSGFPKSHNISKAIDKINGESGRMYKFTKWMRSTGITSKQLDEITGTCMGGHYLTKASQPAIPTAELWEKMRPHCGDVPEWVDKLVERIEAEREVIGESANGIAGGSKQLAGQDGAWGFEGEYNLTAPATPEAQQWDGWGSNLKPAHEPICVARKPLAERTIAANVLEWGTGGINVDGCRVEADWSEYPDSWKRSGNGKKVTSMFGIKANGIRTDKGRWPANLIHDGSDEVLAVFPDSNGSAARFFYCAKASKRDRDEGLDGMEEGQAGIKNASGRGFSETDPYKKIIRRNFHPTVKPTDLMRYLCRLVTPPDGVILDPFCGSGSTGKAAVLEGFNFIGIDKTPEYLPIAERRIAWAQEQVREEQPALFV
jgi:DNA modification methylase